jgi:hypothetical protein
LQKKLNNGGTNSRAYRISLFPKELTEIRPIPKSLPFIGFFSKACRMPESSPNIGLAEELVEYPKCSPSIGFFQKACRMSTLAKELAEYRP